MSNVINKKYQQIVVRNTKNKEVSRLAHYVLACYSLKRYRVWKSDMPLVCKVVIYAMLKKIDQFHFI
jgi:hypothetical protein